MIQIVSLRFVISLVSALSVAVVASITLSITLTSSLAALRTVGSGQAEALLRAGLEGTTNMFKQPEDALEALQTAAAQADWDWPANSEQTRERWHLLQMTLMTESKASLTRMVTYFRDSTTMDTFTVYDGGDRSQELLLAELTLRGTPVDATEPLLSVANQTGLPLEVRLRQTSDWSVIPPATGRFTANVPSIRWKPIRSRGPINWTAAATRSLRGTNGGIQASMLHGAPTSMFFFSAPMFRRGERPRVDPPFAFASAGLLFSDLHALLAENKATPGTLEVVIEPNGYLVASSAADTRPTSTITEVAANASIRRQCRTTSQTREHAVNRTLFQICRLQGSEYGHAGLATLLEDKAFAFSSVRAMRMLTTATDGVFFAGVSPVPLSFSVKSMSLIVLMPEVDVIGDVVKSRNVAIGVTCAVFVVVAVIIFVAISLLLAPLHTIAERMHRAADFDDDDTNTSVSAMAEVAALQLAYYEMNGELNRIRAFVPQSVLAVKKTNTSRLMPRGVVNQIECGDSSADDNDELDMSSLISVGPDSRRSSSANPQPGDGGSQAGSFNKSKQFSTSASSKLAAASLSQPRRTSSFVGAPLDFIASPNFALRNVAVLVANVDGVSAHAETRRSGIAAVLAAAVLEVEIAVITYGGVLGGFHGDHFTVSFNAVKPCAAAQRRACATAWALAEARVGARGSPGSSFADGGLRFRVGVAAGKCQIGNTGTATAKTFSIVGAAFPQAVLLERLTRLYGSECSVLMTARVFRDVATHFRYRVLDHVLLPPRQPTLIAALLGPITATEADDGTATGNTTTTEWLYVVGNQAAGDANTVHNSAFESLAVADLEGCEKALSTIASLAASLAASVVVAAPTPTPLPVLPAGTEESNLGQLRSPPVEEAPMMPDLPSLHLLQTPRLIDHLCTLVAGLRARSTFQDDVSGRAACGRHRRCGTATSTTATGPVSALPYLHDAFVPGAATQHPSDTATRL